jgi:uncharacterized membrane protein
VEQVLPTSRRKQQTTVGFLSLVGGFFGLFAGFSVLSGFEILFFLFLEPLLRRLKSVDNSVHPIAPITVEDSRVRRHFGSYMKNSSIHGFAHIENREKSGLERILWLLLFVIAMVGSYFMVIQVYKSLQMNQIMITMEGRKISLKDVSSARPSLLLTSFPSLQIDFPAITFTDRLQLNPDDLFDLFYADMMAAVYGSRSKFVRKLYRKLESVNFNTVT